jgi:cytochrome P450
MGIPQPDAVTSNPLMRIASDLVSERRIRRDLPPGPAGFSLTRTKRFMRDPLSLLLELHREHGPIFSVRVFHMRPIFMLGPEANQFITVSGADHFHWRESSFGDLIPLLGDGLLTIDEAYHDRARAVMMPAFHHRQIEIAVETMASEIDAALERWRPGQVVDVYAWTRNLAMRIAMRALFGLDPDEAGRGAEAADQFERALAFYGTDPWVRMQRGPFTYWSRMQKAIKALDAIVYDEIRRRRRGLGRQDDILGLLIEARDEDGVGLTDREVRDQVMTLLFAGHDTTTSTVSFLLYELSGAPEWWDRLAAERDRIAPEGAPTLNQLAKEMPDLEMVMDETLRLYPPAWIGPRRVMREFEFDGHHVPQGAYVSYCSWASHRIPEVFPDPHAFIPERFERSRKAALPRGAYVPFGGGSRICIGKRFGQTEVKLIASSIASRFRLDPVPDYELEIRQMPTLSPRHGLPMAISAR